MSRRHLATSHLAQISVLLLLGLSATAVADEAGTVQETFFEAIEVNIVNVDVVVTDRDGDPVEGLTADDFELLEDGAPVEVTNFLAVEDRQPRPLEAAPSPDSPGGTAPAALPDHQRLHLIIFVDNQNITPNGRNRVLDALSDFLADYVRPTDRVMLATYDGSVDVKQPLTGETDRLMAALDEAARGSTAAAFAAAQFRNLLREIEGVNLSPNPLGGALAPSSTEEEARSALAGIRLFSQERYDAVVRASEALTEFVNSLAAVRGRKAVLYVSEGLSLRPGEALFQAWERKFQDIASAQALSGAGEILRLDTGTHLERLAREANANRVTFYAIGAGGLVESSLSSANMGLDSGGDRVWTPALESLELNNLSSSLELLSDATGGFAGQSIANMDDLLRRLRQDFGSYYSLAYTPDHRRDGEWHRIEVRVKNPELRVRHREGYRDKTTEERMADRTRSALLLEIDDNPLGVGLDFGREELEERGRYLVPVIVRIPMGNLVLLPQENFHEGRVTIYLSARDSKGRTSPIQTIAVPIRIPNEQLLTVLGQMGGYNMTLRMREGPHRVAVAVRDELGNIDSAVSARFDPGSLRVGEGRGGAGR